MIKIMMLSMFTKSTLSSVDKRYQLIWSKRILEELRIPYKKPMRL